MCLEYVQNIQDICRLDHLMLALEARMANDFFLYIKLSSSYSNPKRLGPDGLRDNAWYWR